MILYYYVHPHHQNDINLVYLFDHKNDINETINLSKDVRYKNVVDSLSNLLHSMYRYNIHGL